MKFSLVKNKLIKNIHDSRAHVSLKRCWLTLPVSPTERWNENQMWHFISKETKTLSMSCHLKNNLRFQNNQTVTRWILYEINSFWTKHVSVCLLFVFEYYVSKIFKFLNAKLIQDKSFIWSNEIIRHCLDNRDVEPTIVGMFSFKIPKIFFFF